MYTTIHKLAKKNKTHTERQCAILPIEAMALVVVDKFAKALPDGDVQRLSRKPYSLSLDNVRSSHMK